MREGRKVTVAWGDLTLFPLTAFIMRTHEKEMDALFAPRTGGGRVFSAEHTESMVTLVTESARLGNSEIDREHVEKLIDVSDYPDLIAAMFTTPGFKTPAASDAAKANGAAAHPTSAPTGADFSPDAPPPRVGVSGSAMN